jgi:very-short-patch-repair endonuclease
MPTFQPSPTRQAQRLRNNATDAERRLWRHLSRRQLHGFKFSRQMPIGPYICDFLCRDHKLVIEVDGGQHAGSKRDDARTAFLQTRGYRVLRFWNNDVLGNVDGVLQAIAEELKEQAHP